MVKLSPPLFCKTNPLAVKRAFETGGQSVFRGGRNMLRDLAKGGMPSMVNRAPFPVGEKLACTLMHRVALRGIPILVVAQYAPTPDAEEQRELTRPVLDCAARSGLATLDTFDGVREAVREHGASAIYRNDHHTALGNRVVAQQIATELARIGMPR